MFNIFYHINVENAKWRLQNISRRPPPSSCPKNGCFEESKRYAPHRHPISGKAAAHEVRFSAASKLALSLSLS